MPSLQARGPAPATAPTARPHRTVREGSNQAWVVSDIICYNSAQGRAFHAAGSHNTAATNNTVVTTANTNSHKIVGIAVSSSSGVDNTDRIVAEIAGVELSLQAGNGTGAATATALTHIGNVYPVRFVNPTIGWIADVSTTTNGVFEVVSIDPAYPVGEVGGYLRGRFIDAAVGGVN